MFRHMIIPCMKRTTWSISFKLPARTRPMMQNRLAEAGPKLLRRGILGDWENEAIRKNAGTQPILSTPFHCRGLARYLSNYAQVSIMDLFN